MNIDAKALNKVLPGWIALTRLLIAIKLVCSIYT